MAASKDEQYDQPFCDEQPDNANRFWRHPDADAVDDGIGGYGAAVASAIATISNGFQVKAAPAKDQNAN